MNSSKSLIVRTGIMLPGFALGCNFFATWHYKKGVHIEGLADVLFKKASDISSDFIEKHPPLF